MKTLLLILFVLLTAGIIDALDATFGRPLAGVIEECTQSAGSCKWRTGSAGQRFLKDFALMPGLLVYPLSLVAALLALSRAKAGPARGLWLAGALVMGLVLWRFVTLGVYTAVMF